jgi:SAM-dependent methyltransferase
MTFAHSGEVYDRHVGRYGDRLADAMLDFAGIDFGRALDVGCGPGALTRALARRLGAGNVAAIDPSETFVAACRERVPGADVRVGAAEQLPWADRSFDLAASQLVVNFMSDPQAGVAEQARVSHGVVAACVWDYAGEMTMLRAFWDGALELDPGAPDEGRTMRFATSAELERLWGDVGLRDVETAALVVEASYESFDDYWSPFPSGIAPSGAYCASLDPERQGELRDAVRGRLGDPQGPFTLSARAWAVRGVVVPV